MNICFQTTFKSFAQQIRGGLDEDDILGVYEREKAAKADAVLALDAMRKRDKF